MAVETVKGCKLAGSSTVTEPRGVTPGTRSRAYSHARADKHSRGLRLSCVREPTIFVPMDFNPSKQFSCFEVVGMSCP